MIGTCERCRWWKREAPRRWLGADGADHEKAAGCGACRKGPPVAGEQPWPLTTRLDWCGAFEAGVD